MVLGPLNPPLSTEAARQRVALVRRARRMAKEIRQIFTDCDSWNRNVRKPHEAKIDPDPDGKLREMLVGLERMGEIQ